MNKININGFEVGGGKTFIIADIGSNHKQDLTLAKESIDAASEAGANAIKFQSVQLQELYHNPDQQTSEFIKKLEFPEGWHLILKEYCDKKNILFFSSPTYLKAVDLLEAVNVPLYKLASAQIGTFPQIIDKVAALKKPTIFSTGIATYEEVARVVEIFKRHGNDQFIILHCNSIYPTPANKVNLQLINRYASEFGNPVGFSDHTNGIHIAGAAVAMGAKVIEKHFTLDRGLDTPDCSSFASDPDEFKRLVIQIREIENATNILSDRSNLQSEEFEFKESITYRIVANQLIEVNDIIREEHIKYLRSPNGLDCKDVNKILGKKATKKIAPESFITYDCIKFL
jgi:sialic acid synthase SpsE